MPRTYRMISFESISLEMEEQGLANQLINCNLHIFEEGDQSLSHSTKLNPQLHGNVLSWAQTLQFKYKDQTKITFQTYCDQLQSNNQNNKKPLYRGLFYLKSQMFFKKDSCHVYTSQGEKKGLMKWEIKIINKQQEEQAKIEELKKQKPLVRQDLIGLIKINEVSLQITNPVFNKKKYGDSLQLIIKFGQQKWNLEGQNSKWLCRDIKIEYTLQSYKNIQFIILSQGKIILEGNVQCQAIQKLKRYIKHKVSVLNQHGIKIGNVVIDFRYVERQQLLDLLYSPSNKLKSVQKIKSTTELTAQITKPHTSFLRNSSKQMTNKMKLLFTNSQVEIQPSNRYKIGYQMNHNADIFMPRASRFAQNKSTNPYISYIDPEKVSDFSPKRKRGPDISRSSKFDFTRQFKGNPGVGQYKLPSIWSKY